MKKLSRRGLFGFSRPTFSLDRFYADRSERGEDQAAPPRFELRPELARALAEAPPLRRKRGPKP